MMTVDTTPELPEPFGYLGTWTWRLPADGEDGPAWHARTAAHRERIAADTAGWIQVGRRVRAHPNRRIAGEMAGREGTIARKCGPVFADYTMVMFESVGRRTVTRTRMFPIEVLEPVGGTP